MTLEPFVIGDNVVLKFTMYDACGINLIDLRPWVLVFTLKRSRQDPDSAAIFQGTTLNGYITIDDQSVTNSPGQGLGVCEVTIPPSATSQLRQGVRFYWGITLFDVAGNPYTPLQGHVRAIGQNTDTVFVYS